VYRGPVATNGSASSGQAVPDQQPPFLVTGIGLRRTAAVKGGISGASEPLTARTAANDVIREKGLPGWRTLPRGSRREAATAQRRRGPERRGDQTGRCTRICVRRRFP